MTFKSLKERTCTVDIYDKNWNGGVTDLIPAANPITIDEDDDEDLLNVIRAKTGYINVIEENYGDLADLYPKTSTSHYVRVVYGGSLVFIGYMQSQAFEQPVSPGPTELSFPIMSALAMLDDFRFEPITSPGSVTLGELLYEAIQEMDVPYSYVYFPRFDNTSLCILSKEIDSLVVSPFNSEYSPVLGETTDLFSPITYRELIEGICNAFGLIFYDEGNDLIFRRVDHGGTYCLVSVDDLPSIGSNWSTISSVYGDTERPLASYFEWCDDDGSISLVKPFQRIVRELDGEYIENVEFNFRRLKAASNPTHDQYVFLKSETPELSGNYLLDYNTFNYDNYLNDYGVNALIYAFLKGTGELDHKDEMFCVNVNPSWPLYVDLFHIMFAERPTGDDFYVNFTQRWGDRVFNLTDEGEDAHYTLGVNIRINGQYYHTDGVWSSSPLSDAGLAFQSIHVTNAPTGPVELIFKLATKPESPKKLVVISEVRLSEDTETWSDYTVDKNKEFNIDNANGDGDGTTNVSNLLSVENTNRNYMYPRTTSWPTYPYMMQSQKRVKGRYKMNSTPSYQLLTLFYDSDDVNWRIIARSYNYRDDEVTLTLHNSDEFE